MSNIIIFFVYILQQEIQLTMAEKFQNIQNNYDYDTSFNEIHCNSKSTDSLIVQIKEYLMSYNKQQTDLLVILFYFMYLQMKLSILNLKKEINGNLQMKTLIVVIYLLKLLVVCLTMGLIVMYHHQHHLHAFST